MTKRQHCQTGCGGTGDVKLTYKINHPLGQGPQDEELFSLSLCLGQSWGPPGIFAVSNVCSAISKHSLADDFHFFQKNELNYNLHNSHGLQYRINFSH